MRDVHITVAAVIERDGRYLLVEEQAGDRTVLNQPAGHWEPGETLLQAVIRETLEETAWDVMPEALLGVYEYHPPNLRHGFLRFAYTARALQERSDRRLDNGIIAAHWMTAAELRNASARHRSPMVMRCVDDAVSGCRHPLDTVVHL